MYKKRLTKIFLMILVSIAFLGLTKAAIIPIPDISGGSLSSDKQKCEFNITVEFGQYDGTFGNDFFNPQGYACVGDTVLLPATDELYTYVLNCSIGAYETKDIDVQINSNLVCKNEGTECVPNEASAEITRQISCEVPVASDCGTRPPNSTDSDGGFIYNIAGSRYVNKGEKSAVDFCFNNKDCRDKIGCGDMEESECRTFFDDKYSLLGAVPGYSDEMENTEVGEVQTALNKAGCDTPPDCKFGNGTIKAIMECEITSSTTSTGTTGVVCDPALGEEKVGGKCICVPGNSAGVCCGIELLTNVPFIGKCIVLLSSSDKKKLKDKGLYPPADKDTLVVTEEEAFPRLMLGLTKILVTVILLTSFIAIIVAGVMIAASGSSDESATKGRKLIASVVAALALLGASGVILRLINPNFFG